VITKRRLQIPPRAHFRHARRRTTTITNASEGFQELHVRRAPRTLLTVLHITFRAIGDGFRNGRMIFGRPAPEERRDATRKISSAERTGRPRAPLDRGPDPPQGRQTQTKKNRRVVRPSAADTAYNKTCDVNTYCIPVDRVREKTYTSGTR